MTKNLVLRVPMRYSWEQRGVLACWNKSVAATGRRRGLHARLYSLEGRGRGTGSVGVGLVRGHGRRRWTNVVGDAGA